MGATEELENHRCPNCGSFDIEVNLIEGTFCRNCGESVTQKNIVEDYYVSPDGERTLVSSYECPKPVVDNRPFDFNTEAARAAFRKYQKKFKNRRRYQRDRERRYA